MIKQARLATAGLTRMATTDNVRAASAARVREVKLR
jgi:hypothetical protein